MPLDQDRMARNKRKFEENKKKGRNSNTSNTQARTENNGKNGSGKGIWSPPSAHEASHGNKRIICGLIRVYDTETKKWKVEQNTAPSSTPAASASNSNGTRTRSSNNRQGQGNATGANIAGSGVNEKEALIEMHMAQFRDNMREVHKM